MFRKERVGKYQNRISRKDKQEIINIKVKVTRIELFRRYWSIKPTVKNKTLQIPSNLSENCQLTTHLTKTTTKVRSWYPKAF